MTTTMVIACLAGLLYLQPAICKKMPAVLLGEGEHLA
jgi:hypothetical protein